MDIAPPPVVLDASAALALIRSEPHRSAIREVIDRHLGARGRLLVPDIFWLEITNALVRRHALPPDRVVDAILSIDELPVETICQDRPQLLLALDLAAHHDLTSYDAAYLALTEVEDARLLTLDRRLVAAAGERAVRLEGAEPPGVAEGSAAYGTEPIDWARFGPYLARLRAAR